MVHQPMKSANEMGNKSLLIPVCCCIPRNSLMKPWVHITMATVSSYRLRQDGVPVHMLDTQYRMHRQIAAFPSQTFYQGALRTGVPDTQRVPPPGMPKPECNLCFLHLQVRASVVCFPDLKL